VKSFLRPCIETETNGMCILVRTAARWENPRASYEAPACRMTLDLRERQLHDEDKSCGNQPAHIRVIYRRLSAAVLIQMHDPLRRI